MANKLIVSASLFASLLFSLPIIASADDLYTNGSYSGDADAYYFGSGYDITDSFTISEPATIDSIDFTSLDLSADETAGSSIETIDWEISTEPFGGVVAGAGIETDVSSNFDTTVENMGGLDFDVDENTLETGDVPVEEGTYYLLLGEADSTDGGRAYWNEETDGESTASVKIFGDGPYDLPPGGHAFTVYGTPADVPEASTFVDLLIGLSGLAAFAAVTGYRRRAGSQTR